MSHPKTLNPRTAQLPEHLVELTLDTMQIGDVAYVTPWTMYVDRERFCWLARSFPPGKTPGGTVEMRVERRSDGFHVWAVPGYRYTPKGQPADGEYLPVAELHEGEWNTSWTP